MSQLVSGLCGEKQSGWDVVFGMGDIELGSPYADAEFILDMQDFGSAIAKWFYIWNRLVKKGGKRYNI